ncbi:hypothetical protein CA11_53020 [Gimesia maris]|uniref:hypothetical protein n=1 Tax=Gimesia maris TaxID=122 RepID=UPI00118AC08D|nr:hypothetical protein [Gimesia maris]QDU17460.1 hypothetical protein CA11_53020 [Gimesia maris]
MSVSHQFWEAEFALSNPASLASFVCNDGCGIPGSVQSVESIQERIKATYEWFLNKEIEYSLEPWSPSGSRTQTIRHPSEVLHTGRGTCIDLTLMFCSGCLEARLATWIVVIEGHALAMVSAQYSRDEASSQFKGRAGDLLNFNENILTDAAQFNNIVSSGRFLPVECTCLTRQEDFQTACFQGDTTLKKAISQSSFKYAIDLPLAINTNGIPQAKASFNPPWTWLAQKSNDDLRNRLEEHPISIWENKDQFFPSPFKINIGAPTSDDAVHLLDWLPDSKICFVFVCGAGTAGKSSLLKKIVMHADSNFMLFLVNLRLTQRKLETDQRNELFSQNSTWKSRIKALSLLLINNPADIIFHAENGPICLLIDGLNELSNVTERDTLLNDLRHFTVEFSSSRVVVTTREPLLKWVSEWNNKLPISTSDVAICELKPLSDHFPDSVEITSEVKPLGPYPLELRSPFFLDRGYDPYGFVINKLKKEIDHRDAISFDLLSKIAFELYLNHGQLRFSEDDLQNAFEEIEKEQLSSALQHAREVRLVVNTPDGEMEFEHQVFQDCLAARHVAKGRLADVDWSPQTFNALTLNKSSSDALTFALREIPQNEAADGFLERVYDWSWRHAFKCLSVAIEDIRSTERKWSNQIERAFVELLAEKANDPVWKTRQDAEDLQKQLSPLINENPNITQGIEIDWQKKWQEIKDLNSESSRFPPQAIGMIVDENSIVGWTTANALRRFGIRSSNPLDDDFQEILIGLFKSRSKKNDSAIRWRIVHALGVFPREANSELLLKILEQTNESERFVRYGAARSLIEQAVLLDRATRIKLLEKTVEVILSRSDRLEDDVLSELADASLYNGADTNWPGDFASSFDQLKEIISTYPEEISSHWSRTVDLLINNQHEWNPLLGEIK